MNIFASFGDYINLFSFVGGVAVTLICLLHGLNYIRLKTEGPLRERALWLAKKLYVLLFVGLVVFAGLLYVNTDFFTERFVSTLLLLVFVVLSAVVSVYGVYRNRELLSFLATGAILAGVVILLFNGLFPRVMIADNPANSMMIVQASSTPYTLKIMSIVTITALPIVLAYQGWTYYMFAKRIKVNR